MSMSLRSYEAEVADALGRCEDCGSYVPEAQLVEDEVDTLRCVECRAEIEGEI